MVWKETLGSDFATEALGLSRSLRAYRDTVIMRLSGKRLISSDAVRRLRRQAWYSEAAGDHAAMHPTSRRMLEEFVQSPQASLTRFNAALHEFYRTVMEPTWDAIHSRLLADVRMRQNVLEAHGVFALLRTLSPDISVFREDRGGAGIRFGARDVKLALTERSSLTLTPSYFTWPHLQAFFLEDRGSLRCTIVYPIPTLPTVAKARDCSAAVRGFKAIGEPTRFRILELLRERDLSTRELAGYLKVPEPLISRHLGVLLRARLVERRRSGYFVMYSFRREALAELRKLISDGL